MIKPPSHLQKHRAASEPATLGDTIQADEGLSQYDRERVRTSVNLVNDSSNLDITCTVGVCQQIGRIQTKCQNVFPGRGTNELVPAIF